MLQLGGISASCRLWSHLGEGEGHLLTLGKFSIQ